jgi:glycosyltransferase 2 family protein
MRSRVVRDVLPLMKSPALKYVAIAIVTVGLLYLAFRGQDLGASVDAMGRARWIPLLGGLLIMFLSHGVRALRWRIVLRPLKRHTSLWLAFKATIAGYAMNNLIPRSGELVRPYVMARGENIPMAGTLATVVVERLADVLALAALIVFSLVSFQSRVTNVFPMFNGSILWGLAVMLMLLIGLILVFFSERRTEQLVNMIARPLSAKWREKVTQMVRDFSRGIRGLEKSAILPLIVGTVGIWILYGISMYVSLQAFDDPTMSALTLRDAFLLLTLSGIAFTIPTPGGTGGYHFLIKTGLASIFGVPVVVAAAYAILTHILSYISITLVGLGFLLKEGISFGSAKNLQTSSTQIPARTPALQHTDG